LNMISKESIINFFSDQFGAERVLTDRQSLLQPEGVLVRHFEKAFGYVPKFLPVCIVKLRSTEEVSVGLKFCNDNGVSVIVQTGATSSEDQLVLVNDHTVVLDLIEMDKLIKFDTENMMATCECGMHLADLERIANEHGLTTGHCPQSQPVACMGGLVATRSIGQFSTYYGGIEDLLCGLEAVMPDGRVLRIRNVPRRSAGPDLRHLFMGSEGSFAAITEVTVKLFRYYPDDFWKGAFIVDSFERGIDAIREILVSGFKPSVVRLYDKPDFDRNYGSAHLDEGQAVMFFVVEGPPDITRVSGDNINKIAAKFDAVPLGEKVVDHWLATRNDCCNTLGSEQTREEYRQTRVFYTTCEISASWTDIKEIYADVMKNVPEKIDNLVMLGGHVSHSYQNGTNIYFVYELKAKDPLTMIEVDDWNVVNAITTEVLKYPTGGMCHHHGVGKVRTRKMREEHGSSYFLIEDLKELFDPNGIMNPGCLLAQD